MNGVQEMRQVTAGLFTTTALAALILSGCASGPYVQPDIPRPGMQFSNDADRKALGKKLGVEFQSGSTNVETKPISYQAADQYGRFLIDAYNNALQASAQKRRGANLGSIWGGLVALGLEATDNGGDTALITGLSASGLGISSRVLISPSHEAAYSLGARQVICVLSAATDNRPQGTEFDRIEKMKAILSEYQQEYNDVVDSFRSEFSDLIYDATDDASGVIDQAIRDSEATAKRRSTQDKPVEPEIPISARESLLESFVSQIEAIRATNNIPQPDASLAADRAKSEVDALLQDYDRLGAQLFNRIETVRMQVNDAVRRTQPDLIQLNDNLRASVDGGLAFADLSTVKPKSMTQPAPLDVNNTDPNVGVTLWSSGDGELNQLKSELDSITDDLTKARNEDFARIITLRNKINATVKELEDDIKALGGQTVLTFPDNAFAACTGAKIDAIDRAPAIAINPGSFALAEGYEGGTVNTEITGGAAPYFVKDRPDGVSVNGSILSVTLEKNDIKPGGQDQQFIITDTLGKATIFTIKQPPKLANSAGGPTVPAAPNPASIGNEDDTDVLLSGDRVTAVQTALQSADSGQLISRLDIDEVNTYLSETDADGNPANNFVDSRFGPVTRWVVQGYIDDLLDQDANAVSQASCEATDAILTEINDHSLDNNFLVYSQDAIGLMKKQDVDEGLLSLAACLLKVPEAAE
ncbi:hypothetical protein GCM10007853_03540 [Algimonas ampicilliniresistens]|jgi:hypothetical protein|uniref:Secreted protein n=2 Tax=Algimonas ampicilliniresistens TaxID=1298735 RepID=A0ABQ5V5W7_9PROT|nr:hypothetical protein GCM10007853_03540 [Algimonas ampicilliniresistens]